MSSARGGGGARGGARGAAPFGPRHAAASRGGARGARSASGFQNGHSASTMNNGFRNNKTTTVERGGGGHGGQGVGNGGLRGGAGRRGGGAAVTKGSWQERWQVLQKARERETEVARKNGLVADPDNPRSLADAITPVGTCQEMCAEYERVQRVVQNDVWVEETDPSQSVYSSSHGRIPDEARMVKKFRRAAAGLEEQLPSDLRPPPILKKTCDFLFEEVIGNAASLGSVHHFVWDRTRAIRNDFSIQQLTKLDDLRVAVECYERIARFHIMSLHQLAVDPTPYEAYDPQQEREQLDRTLLSLMQYYDDCNGRLDLPNEAEFRSYCVIFQLQDMTPDLEDRIQSWPRHISQDLGVQTALEVYAAASNTADAQGPLKPRINHLVAQQDWEKFWDLIASPKVSYLMACVAEIYFNLIRRMQLNALWRGFKVNPKIPDKIWTLDVLQEVFAFDTEQEALNFCREYGFAFGQTDDGQEYLDLTSVRDRELSTSAKMLRKQTKSDLVESKRLGRIFPAIINGMGIAEAQAAGMTVEEEVAETDSVKGDFDMEEEVETNVSTPSMFQTSKEPTPNPTANDSLFMPDTTSSTTFGQQPTATTTWGQSTASPFASPFAAAANTTRKTSPFGAASSPFTVPKAPESSTIDAAASPFKFAAPAAEAAPKPPPVSNAFSPFATSNTAPSKPAAETPATSPSTMPTDAPIFVPGTFSFSSAKAAPEPKPAAETALSGNSMFASSTTPSSTPAAPSSFFSWQKAEPKPAPTPVDSTSVIPDAHTPAKSSLFNPPAPPSQKQAASLPSFAPPSAAGVEVKSANHVAGAQEMRQEAQASTGLLPAPQTTSIPTSAQAATPAQSTRKSSLSQEFQPNKPSPLRNSYSAESSMDNSTQLSAPRSAVAQPAPPSPRTDFKVLVKRIADDLFYHGVYQKWSFLDQYASFACGETISAVQEKLYFENIVREAEEFRRRKLSEKYGKLWRYIARRRREKEAARKRRERARQNLRVSQGLEGPTVDPPRGARGRGCVSKPALTREQEKAEIDRLFRSTIDNAPGSRFSKSKLSATEETATEPRTVPNKRSANDDSDTEQQPTHKRQRSTVEEDEPVAVGGAVQSVSPASNNSRSSFLGFSLTEAMREAARNTTITPYFRLKAAGLNPLRPARGVKGSASASGANAENLGSRSKLSESRPEQTYVRKITPALTPEARAAKLHDEDEALLARARALREKLAEGALEWKRDREQLDDSRRNSGSQPSSYTSPSLERFRAEARLRASTASADRHDDLPAYRSRPSRFVPFEDYPKALERSQKMIAERDASRSRESSRPATASPGGAREVAKTPKRSIGLGNEYQPAPPIPNQKSKDVKQIQVSIKAIEPPNFDSESYILESDFKDDATNIPSSAFGFGQNGTTQQTKVPASFGQTTGSSNPVGIGQTSQKTAMPTAFGFGQPVASQQTAQTSGSGFPALQTMQTFSRGFDAPQTTQTFGSGFPAPQTAHRSTHTDSSVSPTPQMSQQTTSFGFPTVQTGSWGSFGGTHVYESQPQPADHSTNDVETPTYPSLPASHDYTIAPEQVEETLRSSFGRSQHEVDYVPTPQEIGFLAQPKSPTRDADALSVLSDDHRTVETTPRLNFSPDQQSRSFQDSYMYTQPGDHAGDTEDDELQPDGYTNGLHAGGDTEEDEVETEDDQSRYPSPGKGSSWSANRFGALADQDDDQQYENGDDSQHSQEGQSTSHGYPDDGRDESISHDERDGTDGDIEYDSGDEDEEEEFDEEEESMDPQQGVWDSYQTARYRAASPAPVKNETLQSVGNTQEEAIELSD